MTSPMTADEIIALLELKPHPEGGHFRETWRAPAAGGERPSGTAIYFLLKAGEISAWHRVDATEIWHYHAGAPLRLRIRDAGAEHQHLIGADLAAGEVPQAIVPPFAWQSARSLGDWTLVSCTVSPGFLFEGFELAPNGWSPSSGK
ncbi:cupin domain-containing protein [Rhodoligotrophos ferricapiens]|uniref:cupin domain-containing protein n=1 Tax=Rhodoligotrophos ferricapiens TaxID=3069264 RepID=UPI00315D03D8